MRKKLFYIMVVFSLLFLIGCQQKDTSEDINVDFADAMTEDILVAINNENYEEFSKDFGGTMKEQLNEELFNSQIVGIKDTIGEYEEHTKEVLDVEVVDKNLTRVFYNADYSNEEGNVIITMVFNNSEDNPQVEGLFFNSPKLQKMQ